MIRINFEALPEHYPPFFYLDLHRRFPETFVISETMGGGIVGYMMCRVETGFSPFGVLKGLVRKGHIISIAVLEEHRRRGIGRALMETALEALRETYKCRECYLEVRISNNESVSFYEGLGFKKLRTNQFYYRDGEAAYTMGKSLRNPLPLEKDAGKPSSKETIP